jgi:hypothetical protein
MDERGVDHDIDLEAAEIRDEIRGAETALTPGAVALFERLDTGETGTTPEELRALADDEDRAGVVREEARAYAHLLELLDEG